MGFNPILVLFILIGDLSPIYSQNITENDPKTTSPTTYFDDTTIEEVIKHNDTDINVEVLTESEAVPSMVGTRHDLDQSLQTLIDSGKSFVSETQHIFHEELNRTHTESQAKDVWIAYSKSWGRVFNALVKDIMNIVMTTDEDIGRDLSLDCIASMLDVMTGLRRQKDWAVKRMQ